MMVKIKNKTQLIVMTAILAAIICVLTMFPQIPIPAANGYLHFGDSVIYLAATFLPPPYSLLAGAIGGGLADLISGYAIWMIPTAIIKSLISLPISSKADKILTKKNLFMLIISGIISIAGYFFAGWILFGSPESSIAGLPSSLIQASGSALIFIIAGSILDRANLKKYL